MTRTLRCVLALFLASSAVVRPSAQERSPLDTLIALMADAQKSYAGNSWDEAAVKFQAIVDFAHEHQNDLWEARGLSGLGAVAYGRGQYDVARRLLTQSLETFDRLKASSDLARVERQLGNVAYVTSDPRAARSWFEKAAADAERAGDRAARIRAMRSLLRLNDDEGAPKKLDAIARLYSEAKELHDGGLEAELLHEWADTLYIRGDYEAAIEKLDEAAALYESRGELDELSTAYNSLGRIFRAHGQPRAALQAQLKALAIQETLEAPYSHVQSLNAVAVSYDALGDFAKAREFYERALALAEKVGFTLSLPMLRANLGQALVQAGEVARGRGMIEEAIAGDIPTRRSLRYTEIASADLKLGHKEEALTAAQRALDTCESGERDACIIARLTVAGVQLASGHEEAALANQRAAVNALERAQSTLAASDFLKQGFDALWSRTYSIAIDLETRRGDWREALETAEMARARAFVDLVASRRDAAKPAATMTDLTWRGVSAAGPITLRSDSSASPSTLADLTTVARRQHTTLLEYWIGGSSLYVWVVPATGEVHGARVAVAGDRIEQLVRTVASQGSAAGRNDAWKALYDALVKPVDRFLPSAPGARVTIVPHGPLIQLPFAALRDPQGRYLVERFTLASIPSVAMLRYTKGGRDTSARSGSILLVADPSGTPAIPGEARLPRLPGAMEETRAIARLVPASRATLLTQANATEPRVLAAAPQKSVIHFATHAIVRDGDPWSSFLALGVAGEGTGDGKLTAQKIYGLSLDADLVVLSACRSGGGLITGDGIASLARAFFYAGASSMIVSVWDVADEPAKRLLPAFYRSWLAGADKATALRAAQLALIRDLRAGRVMVATPAGDVALVEDPALWAGFVLLGDPR